MRSRGLAVTGTLAFCLVSHAEAQSVGRMLESDFKNSMKDVGAVWSAPFDASGRDWGIAATALAVTGLAMFADQSASDWAIENDSGAFFRAISPLRRGGKLFSGKYVVPPVAAVYVLGLALKNQDMRDFVTGCMTSWGSQSLARKAVAHSLGRARPDTAPNNPQTWKLLPGDVWQMRSFPAGHFANAVACATFVNHRFQLGAAEPAIYALAAMVGVGRLADRAHWLSDSVIGGVLGYAVGAEVARRSVDRQRERENGSTLNVAPGSAGMTFSLSWAF